MQMLNSMWAYAMRAMRFLYGKMKFIDPSRAANENRAETVMSNLLVCEVF